MTRKSLAFAAILLTAGLAPATAVIGFCAKMPCCFGEAHHGPSLAANDADCCTTISCYEAPSHDLTITEKAKKAMATAQAALPALMVVPAAPIQRHAFDDTSPPPTTKQRLSSLSILLI